MHPRWREVARRCVQGLGVQPGELIQVYDHAGHERFLREILLAVEAAGATPLPRLVPPEYLARLIAEAPPAYLRAWDQYRAAWMGETARILLLQSTNLDASRLPAEGFRLWQAAEGRLQAIEEGRHTPNLVVAVPTRRRAQQLGMALRVLEECLLPALAAPIDEIQNEISRVQAALQGGQHIVLRTGAQYELHLEHGDRPWLADDGFIDDDDRARGAIVSNLPTGSVYSTVVEQSTTGSLALARANEATDVVLHFEHGRITRIEAASGAEELGRCLDSHTGEPRRISHIGVGLNPYLSQAVGWTLVDEHVHGMLFLALGENRYMGGENASSLNMDYSLANASLLVDGRAIVVMGKVVV
ncbi:MAG: aminopeptidase [Herpetosiphonaceae bacterium]|nr:aminopeptidase [Herpetosiphonaceae bacterium]